MIKFEHDVLDINGAYSKEDVDEINAYAEYIRTQERKRILEIVLDVQYDFAHDPAYGLDKLIEYLNEGYAS